MTTHLKADAVVLADRVAAGALVEVSGGVIQRVSYPDQAKEIQELEGTLLPGLVDLQVNGAGGRSVEEATCEALDTVAAAVHAGGATAFLPTLITAPHNALKEQLSAVADWILGYAGDGARPLGIHLEGPFLQNPGAHDRSHFLSPTQNLVQSLLDAARGTLRLVTLAPGIPGAAATTEQLRAAGVAVAIGHGEGEDGISACVNAGARLATHLFNAMGSTHHREPGMAGRILDEERLLCSMILDGVHVHETAARNAYRLLGNHRLVLVTDSTAAAGMPDGDYRFAGAKVTRRDGAVRNPKGNLTGSCLTMAEAARNFLSMIPEAGAYSLGRVGAANPATVLGDDQLGVIHPGHAAEFCVLRPDGTLETL